MSAHIYSVKQNRKEKDFSVLSELLHAIYICWVVDDFPNNLPI